MFGESVRTLKHTEKPWFSLYHVYQNVGWRYEVEKSHLYDIGSKMYFTPP